MRRPVMRLLAIAAWVLAAGMPAMEAAAEPLPPALEQSFKAQGLPLDQIGLIAVPLPDGPPLVSMNAERAFNPASTMKLVTTFAALSMLGSDYRWKTSVYLNGPLQDGVLKGDLVLRGGGDPKLVIEDLTDLVAQMRAAGLHEIRGDLLIDDSLYQLNDKGAQTLDGDVSQPYNVKPHALLMNFKATRFVIEPHRSSVQVSLDPPLADVEIDNRVTTAPGKCRYGAGGLTVSEAGTEFKPVIRVSGRYSPACGEQGTFAAVLNHRQFDHALFKAAWLAGGGIWKGGQTRIEPGAATGKPWLVWQSPRTLADVVQDINKFSNNVMARQLLLQAGAETNGAPVTVTRARDLLMQWLKAQHLAFPELVLENGSGLSREERISPAHLARLLVQAARSPVGDVIRGSLPRVGVDGTMRYRLLGQPVAGNAWIKTGTLNDVRAVAGYVDSQQGRRYAVVMLVNGNRAETSQRAQDAFLSWVHANGAPATE